jgi:hypothetical protein
MPAMTGRLPDRRRPPRCSSIPANRDGEHPRRHLAGYAGILQADAYSGFNGLYDPKRSPGPITEAACWSHGWRKFFVLADVAKAPIAVAAVRRNAIFAIEGEINGLPADERFFPKNAAKLCFGWQGGWKQRDRRYRKLK